MVESPATSLRPGPVLIQDADAAGRLVSQVIQDVLSEGAPGTAYGQQLLAVLDRWRKPNTPDPTIGILPRLTCEANGGDPHLAAPVTAVWRLVRLAAKLFDNVEDGEANDQPAEVVNIATGLLFVAQLMLGAPASQGMDFGLVHHLCHALNRAMLRACAGQHADLAGQMGMSDVDPDTWLEIARAKSGELLAWAAWSGALIAGAGEHTLACYCEYGFHLGVLLQVADDFNGVWHSEGISDLAAGGLTLPVCYAFSVAGAEKRDHLKALLKRAAQGDNMAEVQARQLLTNLGAQAYLLVVGRVQYRQALEALRSANCMLPAGQQLAALLDQVLPALSCTGG